MIIKTEAVVLRKNKISDADVILTLFTRKCGKIRAVAKGGRKPKTKLSAASHPFVYGEFIINKGKNLDKVSSIDIRDSFYSIRENLEKLAYASYFTELCDLVVVEGGTNNRLFNLLIDALHIITYDDINLNLFKLAFELKLLDYSGLRPEINKCVSCGDNYISKVAFNSQMGGILYEKCSNEIKGSFQFNETFIKIINYILNKDLVTLTKLKLSPSVIVRLNKIFEKYINFHLEKKSFKSLSFLKTINENLS